MIDPYKYHFESDKVLTQIYCTKCKKFTTHRAFAPRSVEDGSPITFSLYGLNWTCIECE